MSLIQFFKECIHGSSVVHVVGRSCRSTQILGGGAPPPYHRQLRHTPFLKRKGSARLLPLVRVVTVIACAAAALQLQAAVLYENDFEKAEPDSLPGEFLVLQGEFVVKADGTNKVLELPGAPLDSFGLLIGPAQKENSSVTAMIFGTSQGRRFPAFGVGLNGAKGYTLQVAPAKKELEIARDGLLRKSIPFEWQSGKWTHFYFQVRRVDPGTWRVSGKAWIDGNPEPATPTIEWDDKEEPNSLRASIWGSPFAGTPIRFDNLRVTRLEP